MKRSVLPAIPLLASIALAGFIYEFNDVKSSNQSSSIAVTAPVDQETIKKLDQIKSKLSIREMSSASNYSIYLNDFLTKALDAYNWLKDQENADRYFFLFSLTENLSILDMQERHETIRMWLDAEMTRFKQGDFSYAEDKAWTKHTLSLKKTAQALIDHELELKQTSSKQSKMLKDLVSEMEALKTAFLVTKPTVNKVTSANRNYLSEISIILLGLVGSLVSFLSLVRQKPQIIEAQIETIQKFNHFDAVVNPEPGVSIEDTCSKNLSNLNHIIQAANMNVICRRSENTLNRLKIEKASFEEAVGNILKGTIALAQNDKTQITCLEWNYEINDQRALIDFELMGKEYDLNDLERNHQLLETGSIVSQFARAQNKLSGYRPAIQVLPHNGNTRVRLSLDVQPSHGTSIQ
jgi:hypothetical protein